MVASTDIDHRLLRTHLIGIGGAGMSGIARILLARGAAVSGSDAKDSRTVLALRAQGAVVAVGHEAANLDPPADGPTCVVVSTAIRPDNPELAAARERGIPVLRRAEALALLMAGQRVACVAGTHGKTSTTSMLTVALQHCRLDPSFAIGGDLNESGANAHHGTGGIFVAEADESDGSLLVFEPSVAVVTNVEADHLDHHGTVEAYVGVFDAFLDRITPGGVLIACGDDPGAARLAERGEARGLRVLRYGRHLPDGASGARLGDYRPVDGGGEVDLELITADGAPGERISLRVSTPGRHMADNAAAALLAGVELGAPVDRLVEGLAAFGGVRRRFEPKGVASGVRVYDDYAHHPTEVAAQLDACGPLLDGGRLIVVFQPHLYSRTELFADGFAEALRKADEVIVLDVFGAREAPRPGVTGALIADRVPGARFAASVAEVPALIAGMARPGDLVLTMGAGDVTMLGPEILTEIDRVDAGPDT